MTGADAKILLRQRYFAGARIFREGEPGDRALVVESGLVEIARTEDGRRRVLGHVPPGGIFGEMALIDGKPRMADAHAVEDTVCIVIPAPQFQEKIEAADPFVRALLRILVRSLRELQHSRSGVTPRDG